MADVLMLPSLLEDIALGRATVGWNGALADREFRDWLAANPGFANASTELRELWRVTGGGTIDGETVFAPRDLPAANAELALDPSLVVFHRNATLISAFDPAEDEYLFLRDGEVEQRFATLDDWYTALRATAS